MRIAHVNLAKGFRGGERQTLLLVKSLVRHSDIEQVLVGRRGEGLLSRVDTVDVSLRPVSKPFFFHAGVLRDVDLIHAHEAKASQLALWANLRFGTPYVITRRNMVMPKSNFFTRKVYSRASLVVSISDAIKRRLKEYDATLRVETIPSAFSGLPVDKENVVSLRRKYGNKFIIGHIGALVDSTKGQSYIIEAASKLEKVYPDLHFVFVGGGRDEAALRSKAFGLSNVSFTGFVDNVGDYINLFDMFVFPSLEEGLGSILLDVMEAEKPIVASNVGGIPDIVRHRENGLLIAPGNSEALSNAIRELYRDTELRNCFTSQAKKDVAQFSPEFVADNYREIYDKVLEMTR